MISHRLSIALVAALTSAALPVRAQTEAPLPAPPPAVEPPPGRPSGDPLDLGIEVSLGREEVKRQVADAMGVNTVDVPLTVRMPVNIAERVCRETVFTSKTDTNQSCTATHFAPELVEVARKSMATEAAEQVLPPS